MFENEDIKTKQKEKIETEEVEKEKKEELKTEEQIETESSDITEKDPKNEASEEKPDSKQENDKNKEADEQEKMLEMYEESFTDIKPGEIVDGRIIKVNEQEVIIDIGFKSEGAIPVSEFSDTSKLESNQTIKVYVNKIEDGEGKLKLSKKKADFYLNLEKLKEIYKRGDTIEGVLSRRVKGGMIANILGLEAFLPGSQISLKPIPNLDQFIGKKAQFKIINLDQDRRNIIVSRKKVLEKELLQQKKELKEKIQVGAELDGTVKNITDYGAFIDLGGIDGLLHITDMSWGRINHPSEMLNIGDKLKVKVINYNEDEEKVSLGLKQLVPHPWEHIEKKYPEGTKVSGKVVNLTKYGAFVEIEPGVEGLVHVSEMSWTKKINHPKQLLKEGDAIDAIVLSVSKEDQRISLGIKQMYPNPWLTIDERYPIGTKIKRKVKSITRFGIFVEVDEGIDGLIHISDISWTKRIYHPREIYKVGDEVEAVVLSIDKPLHRIALGIKQLHIDPWNNIDQNLPPNTETTGKISKIIPKGVLVDVPLDEEIVVEGFVPLSHLAVPKLKKPELAFEVGEEIPLKVIELDMENRRLILSVRAFYFGKEDKFREYQDYRMSKKQKKIETKEKLKEGIMKSIKKTEEAAKKKTQNTTEPKAEKQEEEEKKEKSEEKETDTEPEVDNSEENKEEKKENTDISNN